MIVAHLDKKEIKNTIGSMLGTRALQIFDETTCVVRAVLRWTEFYKHESCGKGELASQDRAKLRTDATKKLALQRQERLEREAREKAEANAKRKAEREAAAAAKAAAQAESVG